MVRPTRSGRWAFTSAPSNRPSASAECGPLASSQLAGTGSSSGSHCPCAASESRYISGYHQPPSAAKEFLQEVEAAVELFGYVALRERRARIAVGGFAWPLPPDLMVPD